MKLHPFFPSVPERNHSSRLGFYMGEFTHMRCLADYRLSIGRTCRLDANAVDGFGYERTRNPYLLIERPLEDIHLSRFGIDDDLFCDRVRIAGAWIGHTRLVHCGMRMRNVDTANQHRASGRQSRGLRLFYVFV
jgi:hypothetical protein